ncbi:MAG: magnesium transporter [Bacteroidetes bacterium]|nr:magnesium transporter [Bacteroidota bacterium]
MLGKLLQPEIQNLLEQREYETLREIFDEWTPVDLAELVNDFPEEDQATLFRAYPHAAAAKVFEYTDLDAQETLLHSLSTEEVSAILNDMAPDDRTELFESLPSGVAGRMMLLLSPEERAVAQTLLGYPEGSVGRLMTPDYIAVRAGWTVKQVLDYIRRYGKNSETMDVIYVVDRELKLIDDIVIREFLLSPLDTLVSDIMDGRFVALKVSDLQEVAVEVFRKYDRSALPVVDGSGALVGIVTIDDVLDVAEEEATEDIQKFGGLEALDEPYVDTPLFAMIRKRASWLVVLFLGEMLTATAMGYFQSEIEKAVVLALFVPLIISSGGNSGSQAATLIIRALALGEVSLRDWWFVMRREIYSGLLLGLILGVIGFIRIATWTLFSDIYGPHWVLVGLTVTFSLIGVVLWGTLSGSMLPFVLKKCGADPATSSAPFVATLVDVTGLVIYFTVAMVVLHGTVINNTPEKGKPSGARPQPAPVRAHTAAALPSFAH